LLGRWWIPHPIGGIWTRSQESNINGLLVCIQEELFSILGSAPLHSSPSHDDLQVPRKQSENPQEMMDFHFTVLKNVAGFLLFPPPTLSLALWGI